ncbi:MAG: N-acetylmuramoyl-L-alanine amidase [Sporichthyaceae bacterium]
MRSRLLLAGVAPAAALAVAVGGSLVAAPAQAAPLPLAGRLIAIDPGHQLGNSRHLAQINRLVYVGIWKQCNTTGTATDGGFPEATFAWRTSRALKRRLEALGATVRMTRTTNSVDDWGPCVGTRGRFGAKVGADLEISLHGDGAAAATHGFFVIRPGLRAGWTDDIIGRSRRFAQRVRAGLVRAGFGVSTAYGGDGLDVRRDLGTLNAADVPTVMVELGNMRNAGDARCMTSVACRDRYAAGLAAGIVAQLTP